MVASKGITLPPLLLARYPDYAHRDWTAGAGKMAIHDGLYGDATVPTARAAPMFKSTRPYLRDATFTGIGVIVGLLLAHAADAPGTLGRRLKEGSSHHVHHHTHTSTSASHRGAPASSSPRLPPEAGSKTTSTSTARKKVVGHRAKKNTTSSSTTSTRSTDDISAGGVHASSSTLFATLHVAHLRDGAIDVPGGTRRILIEIGCSDRDTMDIDELDKNDRNASLNDSFLISFEPLLDKYATLLARGNGRFNGPRATDRTVPLGHHHPRGVILPFAVAPRARKSGLAPINVSRIAGCSSLMPFNENTTWGSQCFSHDPQAGGGTFESRLVPTIGITQALALAPAHLPIEKLKLDAQGLDFDILKAAGTEGLRRVRAIELEVVKKSCPTLYQGQATHLTVNSHLRKAGFVLKGWRWHGHSRCEGTAFFEKQVIAADEVSQSGK